MIKTNKVKLDLHYNNIIRDYDVYKVYQEFERKDFVEKDVLFDGGWACHFATADLTKENISILPDIFARCDMPISENYLKYALGYKDSVDEQYIHLVNDDWNSLLRQQPIHKQFLNSLNIAGETSTRVAIS